MLLIDTLGWWQRNARGEKNTSMRWVHKAPCLKWRFWPVKTEEDCLNQLKVLSKFVRKQKSVSGKYLRPPTKIYPISLAWTELFQQCWRIWAFNAAIFFASSLNTCLTVMSMITMYSILWYTNVRKNSGLPSGEGRMSEGQRTEKSQQIDPFSAPVSAGTYSTSIFHFCIYFHTRTNTELQKFPRIYFWVSTVNSLNDSS